MRKIILSVLGLMIATALPAWAADRPDISVVNAYVVLKMDVNPQISARQLLGAARISVRNESSHPLDRLPVTLNSGLHINKAMDGNKQTLTVTDRPVTLDGAPEVQVTEATVRLASPLAPGAMMDLNLYYRGRFATQYAGGIYGVGTPGPEFSLVHYWNFAYPALAPADTAALKALYGDSRYVGDMQLEIPADFTTATALAVIDEKTAGSRKTVRLRGERAGSAPFVAVGHYEAGHFPGVTVFYMDGNGEAAEQIGVQLSETGKTLGRWLGAAPQGNGLTVIDLPAGNGHAAAAGWLAMPLADTPSAAEIKDLRHDEVARWMPDAPAGNKGAWRAGLMALALDLAGGKTMDAIKADAFEAAKADTSGADFSPAVAKLMFCLIDDLAGDDGFRDLVAALRQTFTGMVSANLEVAPYLAAHAPNKKVKKLIEAWMQDGKAMKTLGKAGDYAALVKKVG